MKYSEVEYSYIRTELIHHDGSCLNILGLLLASSTAIYGFVAERGLFPLLIMLSLIWLVGFLYIVEKRSTIRRISRYIQTRIETESDGFNWETYSRQHRYPHDKTTILLPTLSPLKIEFSLLVITNLINTVWLWSSDNINLAVGQTLLAIFALSWSGLIIFRYYSSSQKEISQTIAGNRGKFGD